jgi:hypothetical protein
MISTLLKNSVSFNFRNGLRSFVVIALLNLLFCANSTAQVTNYSLSQLQLPSYAALVAPPATNAFATSGNIDNGVGTIPLTFTFQYNGGSYTSVNISMNGFVTFGATVPALNEVAPISSAVAYSGVIAGFIPCFNHS